MAWLPYALTAFSTVTSMAGEGETAENKKRASFRAAFQLEDNADNAIAAGQRNMLKERRNTELVASRAVALAAASGSDVTSPDIINIISDIEGEGAYRESVALYEGEQEARNMRQEAQNLREGASSIERAAQIGNISTAISGASSIYGTYAKRNPGGSSGGSYG